MFRLDFWNSSHISYLCSQCLQKFLCVGIVLLLKLLVQLRLRLLLYWLLSVKKRNAQKCRKRADKSERHER